MINMYLKELKDTSGMTMQQIADKSNVPISTVERILNGKTEQPSFKAVSDIVIALNGSVDVLMGIKEKNGSEDKQTKCDVTNCAIIDLYERQKQQDNEWKDNIDAYYQERIDGMKQFYLDIIEKNAEKHREEIELKEQWIRRLFYVCIGMAVFLICLIICDFLVGGNGLIRYS